MLARRSPDALALPRLSFEGDGRGSSSGKSRRSWKGSSVSIRSWSFSDRSFVSSASSCSRDSAAVSPPVRS